MTIDESKLQDHLAWFVEKISSDTYQTHDDDDPLLSALLEAELKARNINIDVQTICMLDRLKRSLSQHIGTLWQRILGSAEGWRDLGIGDTTGCDLINEDKKKVIELKNKWNTMNSSSLASVSQKLAEQKDKGYDAYIGIINPKNGKAQKKELKNGVKQVSGSHLFQLVFDDEGIHEHIINQVKVMYEGKRKLTSQISLEETLANLQL